MNVAYGTPKLAHDQRPQAYGDESDKNPRVAVWLHGGLLPVKVDSEG